MRFFLAAFCLFSVALMLPDSAHAVIRLGSPNTATLGSGLVAYWPFDGSVTNWTTGQTRDLSGQGNSGILINLSTSTSPVTSKIGNSLRFNGTSTYINVGDIAPLGTKATFAAWVYITGTGAERSIISKRDAGNSATEWQFGLNSTKFKFSLAFAGSTCCTDYTLDSIIPTLNMWYHIAATFDDTTNTLNWYLNGTLVETDNPTESFGTNTATITTIGATSQGTQEFFPGIIDDLRIYNRALSATEVKQLYTLGSAKAGHSASDSSVSINNGLVGYWTFDGADVPWTSATAGTVKDRTGISSAGTLTNFKRASSPVPGIVGQALLFFDSGVASEIPVVTSAADTGLLNNTTTVSVWVKPQNVTGGGEYAIFAPNSDHQWWIELIGNSARWSGLSGAGSLITGGSAPSGKWSHLAFVGSSLGVKIYVNGNLSVAATDRWLGSLAASPTTYIGSTQSRYFSGALDDLRVYNRELSATEIKQLAAMGTNNVGHSNAGNSNGLVGYWSFDGSATNWSTNTTADLSGNGNTGTMVSMSTSTSPAAGKVGQAFRFSDDGRVDTVTTTVLSPTLPNGYSGALWIKTIDTDAYVYEDSGSDGLAMKIAATGIYCQLRDAGFIFTSANSTARNGQWHHVVCVFDQNTNLLIMYIDGQFSSSVDASAFGSMNGGGTSNFHIPARNSFTGALDDVRLYNRALSAAEVQQLYNAGK